MPGSEVHLVRGKHLNRAVRNHLPCRGSWTVLLDGADSSGQLVGYFDAAGEEVVDVCAISCPGADSGTFGTALRSVMRELEPFAALHLTTVVGDEVALRAAWDQGFTIGRQISRRLVMDGTVVDAWTATLAKGTREERVPWRDADILRTPDTRLRPLSGTDLSRMVEGCSDPESAHWMGRMPHPYTAESASDAVNEAVLLGALGQRITWCIADPETDRLLGVIVLSDLHLHSGESCEVGYWLHPEARGRGLAVQVVRAVLRHAGEVLGIDRVWLITATENAGSNAVAKRAGFKIVGTQSGLVKLGDGSFAIGNVYEQILTDNRGVLLAGDLE